MTTQHEEDRTLIAAVDSLGRGLTPWEIDRVEQWLGVIEDGGTLTQGQRDKLHEIYEQRVETGGSE